MNVRICDGPLSGNKRCTGCLERRPFDEFELYPASDVKRAPGARRSRCNMCRSSQRATGKLLNTRANRSDPDYIPGPKPCDACGSMTWRVAGHVCVECALEYADEPKPELQLRRFDQEREV